MTFKTALGGLVALGFIAVSTFMAARFGYSLGSSDYDRLAYAGAGAFADVMKALLPFFIVGAWIARQHVRSIAGAFVFAAFTVYSLTSAFGLAAIQTAEKTGAHAAVSTSYKDRRAEVTRLETQRAALGTVRPIAAIEADIRAAKIDRLWELSEQCRNPNGPKARDHCKRIEALDGETATARAAADLEEKIATARAKLEAVDVRSAETEADPQSTAISKLTGVNADTVRAGLHVLVAILIELGSGLGLYLVFGHHGGAPAVASPRAEARREEEPAPMQERASDAVMIAGPTETIGRFVLESIRPALGERVSGAAMFTAYEEWCESQGLTPVSAAMFGRVMPWRKERIGGRVWYLDASLAEGAGRNVVIDMTAPRRLGHMNTVRAIG